MLLEIEVSMSIEKFKAKRKDWPIQPHWNTAHNHHSRYLIHGFIVLLLYNLSHLPAIFWIVPRRNSVRLFLKTWSAASNPMEIANVEWHSFTCVHRLAYIVVQRNAAVLSGHDMKRCLRLHLCQIRWTKKPTAACHAARSSVLRSGVVHCMQLTSPAHLCCLMGRPGVRADSNWSLTSGSIIWLLSLALDC